jgi:hypothetical protein
VACGWRARPLLERALVSITAVRDQARWILPLARSSAASHRSAKTVTAAPPELPTASAVMDLAGPVVSGLLARWVEFMDLRICGSIWPSETALASAGPPIVIGLADDSVSASPEPRLGSIISWLQRPDLRPQPPDRSGLRARLAQRALCRLPKHRLAGHRDSSRRNRVLRFPARR